MKSKNLISLDISLGSYDQFLENIRILAEKRESSYVCVANVHMLVEAYKNREFQYIVNNADIVSPDGMPLAKSLKLLYSIKQDRVAGMDLLPDLLKKSEKKLSVYFYGGTQQMLDDTIKYCKVHYPNLDIVGAYSPPFRDLTEQENQSVINQINLCKPNFVFVALGCPKQEKWMASMKGKINTCMIGIGGALPVMVGIYKRAPKWMQQYGLEWLFRLAQDPKRLFKRYIFTNSIYIYLLLITYFKIKILRVN